MDVVLPRMNGLELAEWLVSRTPRTKVLLTTGYPDEALAGTGVLKIVVNEQEWDRSGPERIVVMESER